jgi:hypothetical protein
MERIRMRHIFAVLGLATMVSVGTAEAQTKILPVVLHWQETSEWCWAASGEMVMEYLGGQNPREVPQCYEANEEFGRTDCCTCPTPAACVNPGWPQFDTWNFNSTTTPSGTALSWSQVMGQINNNQPFVFAWAWNGGGGHAMVAKGYFNFDLLGLSWNWIWVDNPWPPQGRCGPGGNVSGPFGGDIEVDTYAEFVGGPGYDHTHMADIYNVSYK